MMRAQPRIVPLSVVAWFVVVLSMTLLALLLPAHADARTPPGMPPAGKVMLGVGGHALYPPGFNKLTGGMHELHIATLPWNESRPWDWALERPMDDAAAGGYRIVLQIGANRTDNGREGRSPGAVSRGAADRYLLGMSRYVNERDQFIYIRPPAEMNGHWSLWSAFNSNGTRRNADHSTRSYRRAFIRIAAIMRGGGVASINRALTRNGMPRLRTDERQLPRSGKVALVWNPQGRGSPDVRGNQPKDYYPGAWWVDYVANDVYAQHGRAAWADNDALYRRYSMHPFMIAEYAPWGYDDVAFMRRMFRWVATHRRTVGLAYFNGTSGRTFRLSSKPRSLAAYRAMARQSRYRCAGFDAFSATC